MINTQPKISTKTAAHLAEHCKQYQKMHGRVKVRTTAEQEAIRKAEREKKAKEFNKGIDTIFEKRKRKELDNELLDLTQHILEHQPEVYTLWNIRREIFALKQWTNEERVECLKKELYLTKASLKANPKCYSSWFHRIWVIDNFPEHDLKVELALCKEYLNVDERNFHCWDYRAYIVKKANIDDEEELAFTYDKIANNFSNYSSWRYRSQLLTRLHPGNGDLPIEKDKHNEELEVVSNAHFTDPNDSSSWFYHQWLWNYWKSPQKFWKAFAKEGQITIVFHKQLPPEVELYVNGNFVKCKWRSVRRKKADFIWISNFEIDCEKISLKFENTIYNFDKLDDNSWICNGTPIRMNDNNPKLLEQLDFYQKLVEMEEKTPYKWARLTILQLMIKINFVEYHFKILEELENLKKIDPLRLNYWDDLKSRCIIEYKLHQIKNIEEFSLANLDLTTISGLEQYFTFAKKLDLSNNRLGDKLSYLYTFQQCEELNLSNNGITNLQNFPKLDKLKTLTLDDNRLTKSDEVLELLNDYNNLKLSITNNPMFNLGASVLANC